VASPNDLEDEAAVLVGDSDGGVGCSSIGAFVGGLGGIGGLVRGCESNP
jgi:hypothetical protein